MPRLREASIVVQGLLGLSLLLATSPTRAQNSVGQASVEAFASLPAETYRSAQTSGQFIRGETNGVRVPFHNFQPVQGVSSVLAIRNGQLLILSDNGYGSQDNSADYVLGFYEVEPGFRSAARPARRPTQVGKFVALRDPDKRCPFPIVADGMSYPNGAKDIAVDSQIRERRLLTGADFDVESFREMPDGTFWFGEEFGPFLLHTDATGKLLEAPIPIPGARAPQNPTGAPANLASSKGIEGLALSADGKMLHVLLEGPLTTEKDRHRLRILDFDVASRKFLRERAYRLEMPTEAGHAIGEITAVNEREFLVIERDSKEGDAAEFKKLYLVDFGATDSAGFVKKTELADLLRLHDPKNITGYASATGIFRFPFTTIESVLIVDSDSLILVCDNNFPFSHGRNPARPDNTEFVQIRLNQKLRLVGTERRALDFSR